MFPFPLEQAPNVRIKMLPREVIARLLNPQDILGLQMTIGTEKKIVYFTVDTVEGPNDLADFSIGAASALSTTGTGWSEIQDSAGRFILEPEYENIIYQFYIGIAPASAWLYRRYPGSKDLNSLLGTRAIGSGQGHIDGLKSPYKNPTPITEMYTVKNLHPSFLGYNPFADPSSITVRLYFYVTRYDVTLKGLTLSEEEKKRAAVRTMGGHDLVPAPTWIETRVRG